MGDLCVGSKESSLSQAIRVISVSDKKSPLCIRVEMPSLYQAKMTTFVSSKKRPPLYYAKKANSVSGKKGHLYIRQKEPSPHYNTH